MEFITTFLVERWYVVVAAIVVLFLAVKLLKSLLKWGLVLAVIVGLFVYSHDFRDKVVKLGTQAGTKVAAETKELAVRAFQDEVHDAHYEHHADGSFTVTTKSVKLEGRPKAHEAQVTFMHQTFTMQLDGALNALVEQAKKNAGL